MEAKIINLERTDDPNTIKKIVLEVVKIMNVNQIYLTIGKKEHAFKYHMVIITEDMARIFKEQVGDRLNRLLKAHPQFYARSFTLHYVRDETNIGNTFFLCNCTKETLIYCNRHFGEGKLFKKMDFSKFVKKAGCLFMQEMEKVESFKKGADLFIKEGRYNQAAFMLHQTFELGFLTAELFLVGTTFKGHSINAHQIFIEKINKELGSLFPNDTDKQKRLLKKLDSAYVKGRYHLDYRIKRKQVNKLNKKAEKLISLLEAYIDVEMIKCQKAIELLNDDSTTKDDVREVINVEDNETNAVSKKTLEVPNNRREPEYLVRKFEFINSFEMLCISKSMMNLCIISLQDEVDSRGATHPHLNFDVLSTLQIIVRLLPLKETSP